MKDKEPSLKEKLELLNQLRSKHKKAREEFGAKVFNEHDLEKRILMFMNAKSNIYSFLQNEMDFYENLRNIAEKKNKDEEKSKIFKDKVDDMILKNEEKIKQYPDAFFDPNASFEIRYFIGSITEFIDKNFDIISFILRGTNEWKNIKNILSELERFYVPFGASPTFLLKDYIDKISNQSFNEVKRQDRFLLQTAGLLLYRMQLNLFEIQEDMVKRENEIKIQLPYSWNPKTKDIWQGIEQTEVLSIVMKHCLEILNNFRITDLVKSAFAK